MQLLVYGSLRQGHAPNRMLEIRNAKFLGEERVSGFDMFNLGWFPGIKENPDNKKGIVGELYEIPDHLTEDLFQVLDHYEGYREDVPEKSLYLRKNIPVRGNPTTIYVYNGKTEDRPYIKKVPTGNWKDVQL